jgi:MFS transporter, PAT family, beta-lactamase induction signal transducer AmpG
MTSPTTTAEAAPIAATASTPYRSPIRWVPTLYFAEGLPLWVVLIVAGQMYKSMGIGNDTISWWTGLIGFAWVFKPLWSPFLEALGTNRSQVVLFQLLGGASMLVLGVTLNVSSFFAISIAMLGLVAVASATHDIAADGLYIANLSAKLQAEYAGWQGAFYNAAKFASAGGLLILAGQLEKAMAVPAAWTIIFAILGLTLVALAAYHWWALPRPQTGMHGRPTLSAAMGTLREVFVAFFRKPGIWLAILFIILFRAGEAQVANMAPLFLRDARSAGGLGLDPSQVGWAYGTAGTLAFIVGSILGGYFAAWLGLRRAMIFLIIGMNLPNLAFFYLSAAMPSDLTLIVAAIFVENLGFGFGFVGLILYMMQVVAPGRYQTAHYAFGTGFMALGMVIFRSVSGSIQLAMGYQNFFFFVLLCAIPVLILSLRIVPRNEGTLESPLCAAQRSPAQT